MKAVLFDLDDTLYPELDFVRSGFDAVGRFLEGRYGVDSKRAAARMFDLLLAEGRGDVFNRIVAELGVESTAHELVPTMVYVYRSHRPHLAPYVDVPPVLRRLADSGLRIGVLTDGLASVQRGKLAALELGVELDPVVIVGELPDTMAKPSPMPYRVAAELLELLPAEITYVGNDPFKDFAGARAVGMRTIRVRTPSETFPRGVNSLRLEADQYIDPFSDIVPVLVSD